jgi:hypothetical protein
VACGLGTLTRGLLFLRIDPTAAVHWLLTCSHSSPTARTIAAVGRSNSSFRAIRATHMHAAIFYSFFFNNTSSLFIHAHRVQRSREPKYQIQNSGGDQAKHEVDPGPNQDSNERVHEHSYYKI